MESATLMKRATCIVALLALLFASPAFAGPVPLESGTVSFSGPPALDGSGHHLDGIVTYWVYSPNTFPYPLSDGYTPTPTSTSTSIRSMRIRRRTTNSYYDQIGNPQTYPSLAYRPCRP